MAQFTAFPWNAPKKKPGYATLALAAAWDEMWQRVDARMKKLREVAVILKKDEDTVAWAVQHMFCDRNGKILKDASGNLLLDVYKKDRLFFAALSEHHRSRALRPFPQRHRSGELHVHYYEGVGAHPVHGLRRQ